MDLDDELRKLFADERLDVRVRPEADRVIVTGARRIRRRRAGVVFGGGMLSVATMLVASTAFGVSGDAPHQTPVAVAADTPGPTTTTATPTPVSTTTTVVSTTTVVPAVPTTVRTTTTTPKPSTTTSSTTRTKAKPPSGALLFGPTTVNGLRLGMTASEAVATGLVNATPGPVDYYGCQGYQWAGRAVFGEYYPLLFSPKLGLVKIGGIAEAETPEGVYVGSTDADVRATYPTQSKSHIGSDWVTPVPGNPTEHYWFIISDHTVTQLRLELATQDCYQ